MTRFSQTTLAVLGGVFYVSYSLLYCDKGLNIYDEGWVIVPAVRILSGEVPYRDFWVQVNPLSHYLLAGVFAVLGPSLLAARLTAVGIGAVSALLIFLLGSRVGSRWAALAAAICYAFWSTNQHNIYWYSNVAVLGVLLSLAAVRAHFDRRSDTALVLAGALTGLTYFTKQNIGSAVALSIGAALLLNAAFAGEFFSRRHLRRVVFFAAGAIASSVLCLTALAAGGALRDWYALTVDYATWYASQSFNPDPFHLPWTIPAIGVFVVYATSLQLPNQLGLGWGSRRRVLVAAGAIGLLGAVTLSLPGLVWNAPTTYVTLDESLSDRLIYAGAEFVVRALPLLFIVSAAVTVADDLRRRRRPDPVFLTYLLVAPLCLYAANAANADASHLITGGGQIWILLPRIVDRWSAFWERTSERLGAAPTVQPRKLTMATVALFVVLVAVAGEASARSSYVTRYAKSVPVNQYTYTLTCDRGRGIKVLPEQGAGIDETVAYVCAKTAPEEPIFCFPNETALYMLIDRPNASYYNGLLRYTFTPGDAPRVIDELRKVRYVIRRVFPGSGPPKTPEISLSIDLEARPIRVYIDENFQVEASFGAYRVLRRVDRVTTPGE
jgi:hypothetical protein